MEITEICNMALSYIGKGAISSINENSEPSRQCKMFYDHTRKQLLRKYYFSFAKRLDKLALLDYDHPKWKYTYAYPNECLFIRKIFNAEEEAKPVIPGLIMNSDKPKFEVLIINSSVKAIGTDIELAKCEYTYNVTDENLFPDDFVEGLARMVAFNICLPLTGDTQLQQMQFQLAKQALYEAMYTTAMEQYDKLDFPHSYENARR